MFARLKNAPREKKYTDRVLSEQTDAITKRIPISDRRIAPTGTFERRPSTWILGRFRTKLRRKCKKCNFPSDPGQNPGNLHFRAFRRVSRILRVYKGKPRRRKWDRLKHALASFENAQSVGGTKTGSRGALFSFSGGGEEKRREKRQSRKRQSRKRQSRNDKVHRSETRERVKDRPSRNALRAGGARSAPPGEPKALLSK